MDTPKKVLIITVTCGEGHNNIAKAIKNGIESCGSEAKIIDLFESNQSKRKHYNNIYLWACKYVPHIYQVGWKISRKIHHKKLKKSPAVKNTKPFAEHILNEINEYKPDSIVCVHVEAGALISYLKQSNKINKDIVTYTVMFDYVLCPYWDTNIYLDYCFTPAEFCHEDLIKVGFNEKQLVCSGFPVNEKFVKMLNKQDIRTKLNLENKFTFFSVAGGNGLGNTLKLLKQILKTKGEYQVIMVCGKNHKDKNKIDKYIQKNNIKNVLNFGFVNNINELINASDIAFARGGGNGISECFYSGIPVIFRKGLINNEKENAEIFVKLGFGYRYKNNHQLNKLCQSLIDEPSQVVNMQKKIMDFMKPEPTKNIAKFIIEH